MPDFVYLSLCAIPFLTSMLLYPLVCKPFATEMADDGKFVIINGLRDLAATTVIIHHGILMTNLFMHSDWRINAGADWSRSGRSSSCCIAALGAGDHGGAVQYSVRLRGRHADRHITHLPGGFNAETAALH
ncbi:MAG: hypothetical protein ACR5LG_01550 [Sodalis sp. (in: enterobacteria)]|uniref:hypothetical protein n=1 Tax=Sodalis sp. (in: enterobacteria) TaxID=1898979 RepID=UPI003F308585